MSKTLYLKNYNIFLGLLKISNLNEKFNALLKIAGHENLFYYRWTKRINVTKPLSKMNISQLPEIF